MLFNSFEFIFLFVPITLLVFSLIVNKASDSRIRAAKVWIVVASLFFYAWWRPANLYIIGFSLVFNYVTGYLLCQRLSSKFRKRLVLIIGIAVNLALIGYFKYANFVLENINAIFVSDVNVGEIALPLAISFFTFQQIAYLVDAYQGGTKEFDFLNYSLFVTFFPQLIAGPIVHHRDVLPQFSDPFTFRLKNANVAIGLTVFAAGLFKKVIFADTVALFATPVFDAAAQGITPSFFEAWVGALAYTLQLYFDFSGYSDMAIGIAYLFGIQLPLNFNSPYKAINISDFWRRWHITLSNFLRDYLYIPLGGSRKGDGRRYLNLMITMLLGGLWHGAGWTYVLWGGLHGFYLVVNHGWHTFLDRNGYDRKRFNPVGHMFGWLVTFLAVVVSWVLFRATSLQSALSILASMVGLNGISLPGSLVSRLDFMTSFGVQFDGLSPILSLPQGRSVAIIAALMFIVCFAPNIQEWMADNSPALNPPKPAKLPYFVKDIWDKLRWRPNLIWAIFVSVATIVSVVNMTRVSEFLYFEF
ncbi:MAG: MBOAT family protein [Cyanothece sp. SIO2G6]|nr:MBOAT family protein [Cyanothece sp. SIO2G6]